MLYMGNYIACESTLQVFCLYSFMNISSIPLHRHEIISRLFQTLHERFIQFMWFCEMIARERIKEKNLYFSKYMLLYNSAFWVCEVTPCQPHFLSIMLCTGDHLSAHISSFCWCQIENIMCLFLQSIYQIINFPPIFFQ